MPTVIVPVGLHLGAEFAVAEPPSKDPEGFLVASGDSLEMLDAVEMKVWAASFLDPKRHARLGVSRETVQRYLLGARKGLSEPGPIVDRLIERGLLLEFDPIDGPLEEIFVQYTLRPVAEGLGSTAKNPMVYRIGHNARPAVEVDDTVFYLWAFSHTRESLWDACVYLADESETLEPGDMPLNRTPEEIARNIAVNIPLLISNTCAVIDPVVAR
jgi:hypothetical protein